MTLKVWFTQYYDYDIEVDDEEYENDPDCVEDRAKDEAYEYFRRDMSRPVAHTWYDEVEVEVKE
jgi:hypothetical protein